VRAATLPLETFSRNAADLIRLRAAFYGPEDAKVLMMRCYRRSKATKINERTVLNAWAELDAAMEQAGIFEDRAKLLNAMDANA
jgi:hypothetical protein